MLKQILKVLIYIERHIDATMTLSDLGKVAGYSPFHLHRLFKAIVGESIHQYIKRLRLEKAEGQLRYTDEIITDIALDTNFETPSAFSKAFKQVTGRSPSHYRNLHKEIPHNCCFRDSDGILRKN